MSLDIRKVLVVDFVNKKVTGAYEGPSGQTFIPLTQEIEAITESRKRVVDSIERIDKLIRELNELNQQQSKED